MVLSVALSAHPLQVVPYIHEIGTISPAQDVVHLMGKHSAHRTHRMCAQVEACHASPVVALQAMDGWFLYGFRRSECRVEFRDSHGDPQRILLANFGKSSAIVIVNPR